MPQPRTSALTVSARVLIAVFTVALFATALVVTWRSDTALDERGASATAEVLSVSESTRGSATATVRFTTADGRTITTVTRPDELVDPPPAVGSTMPVVYDPEDPQAKVRDPRAQRDTPISPVVVAGAGVALIGALLVGMLRRRTRPARTDAD